MLARCQPEIAAHWPVILNLLAGSLIGAWLGAGWATRLKFEHLYRVIAVLLVIIAAVLVFGQDATAANLPLDKMFLIQRDPLLGLKIHIANGP